MIFDGVSGLIILGLIIRRWRNLFRSKIALIVTIIISLAVSSALTPIYINILKGLNIETGAYTNVVSFILTFILIYIILGAPGMIFSVLVIGSVVIVTLGVLVDFLPPDVKMQILSPNSAVFNLISPLVRQLYNLIKISLMH